MHLETFNGIAFFFFNFILFERKVCLSLGLPRKWEQNLPGNIRNQKSETSFSFLVPRPLCKLMFFG